jgi:hypothetical protein
MGKTLEEMMNRLPKERQERIEARTAELIAEEKKAISQRSKTRKINLTSS